MRRTDPAMPKPAFILLAALSLALVVAACNNSTPPNPTPAPSVSLSPNPKISDATIDVTIRQTPAPHIPVQESTPKSSVSPRPGTPFVTQQTDKNGSTKFKNLKPGQTYCWVAILGPNQTSSTCAGWEIWQYQPITLGT
ncbi:MAG TPA: hypothetical protein VJP76_08990 [Candidatus Tumulicola sp.]|nr:hypothetical protein [Candidatus Tumulicola sp.]